MVGVHEAALWPREGLPSVNGGIVDSSGVGPLAGVARLTPFVQRSSVVISPGALAAAAPLLTLPCGVSPDCWRGASNRLVR